jgi:hypothetical protein
MLSDAVVAAAKNANPVQGHTHAFYRYPARFSPEFVRAVIQEYTRPGETVVDPFMGGGTTAVEAFVLGRRFIGCDINSLSRFIATVKTCRLNRAEAERVLHWSDSLVAIDARVRPLIPDKTWRNVPWWLRNFVGHALARATHLRPAEQRFARCTVLRTAQWALDCRRYIPTTREFVSKHHEYTLEMLAAVQSLPLRAPKSSQRLLLRSASELHLDKNIPRSWLPAKLVVTSPPYPGVHILYHRWQVRGRRETPVAYPIAACMDGSGAAYYTFGDRSRKDLDVYLDNLRACMESTVSLLGRSGIIVQLVGFSDPGRQLPLYLGCLESIGLNTAAPTPISRSVPNRKWYADLKGQTPSSTEVLLVHTKP